MPIVNGQYQAKISTVFATVKTGLAQLREKITKSKKIRIANVPISLLEKLLSLFGGKDVKIILPIGEKPTEKLKQTGDIAVQISAD